MSRIKKGRRGRNEKEGGGLVEAFYKNSIGEEKS